MWAPPVTVVLYQWEVQCCDVTGGAAPRGGRTAPRYTAAGFTTWSFQERLIRSLFPPSSAVEDKSELPMIQRLYLMCLTSILEAPQKENKPF